MVDMNPVDDDDSEWDGRGAARRTGRRQGSTSTRQDIIWSARKLFAERGYRGATMRAIAQDAHVDAALIHHFFASKEGVFSAAIEDAFRPGLILDAVLTPGPGSIGERLIHSILTLCDDPETRDPLLAVIRSAVAYDDAARLVKDFLMTEVLAKIVNANASSHTELRTLLTGSQIIGMLVMRYMIGIEPLASLAPDAVCALYGPQIDHCLYGDLDVPNQSAMSKPADAPVA